MLDAGSDANGAAWAMRRCFDALLDSPQDVVVSDMPSALAIKAEADFPIPSGQQQSSCCEIA